MRSRRVHVGLAIGLAVLLATSAAARTAPPADVQSAIDAAFAQVDAKHYDIAIRQFDLLLEQAATEAERAQVHYGRGAALAGLHRAEEANTAFALAQLALPSLATISSGQVEVGLYRDEPDVTFAGLNRLINVFPDVARDFDRGKVNWARRQIAEAHPERADSLTVSLAQIGFGKLDADYYSALAIKILLKRGETASAEQLAMSINSPMILEQVLVERQFAPLWPILERQAGPGMARADALAVEMAAAARREHPDDPQILSAYIELLAHTGRTDEAIRLGQSFATTPAELEQLDLEAAWVIDQHASVLASVGKVDEADQRYAGLTGLDETNRRWLVNQKINQALMLTRFAKRDRLDEAIAAAERSAAAHGTDYARQLVRFARICAAMLQSRQEPATLTALKAHAKDAPMSTIEALICANEDQAAESLIVEQLQSGDPDEELLLALQRHAKADGSPWQKKLQAMRERPAVSAAFDRVARDLPAALQRPQQ